MNKLNIGDWVTVLREDGTQYLGNVAKYGTVHSISETGVEVVLRVEHPLLTTLYTPLFYTFNRIIKHE